MNLGRLAHTDLIMSFASRRLGRTSRSGFILNGTKRLLLCWRTPVHFGMVRLTDVALLAHNLQVRQLLTPETGICYVA